MRPIRMTNLFWDPAINYAVGSEGAVFLNRNSLTRAPANRCGGELFAGAR